MTSTASAGAPATTDCGSKDGSDLLTCLLQNPFVQQFQATSIWTAIGTSVGATAVITIAFSFLRPYHSIVYAPKLKYADQKHAPPSIGKGLFAWFGPVAKMHEAALIDKIGLDATVFLRFTKMCRDMFIIITLVSVGIILPTNVITNGKSSEAKFLSSGSKGFWQRCTPQYTIGTGLWIHVACIWVVNVVVGFFLWRNYIAVTRLRRQYFESSDYLMSLHSRTLMFTDIPPASRTDEGILRLADEVEQTSGLPRAAIARNVKELPELIEAHEKAVRALESVLAKYLKNPDRLPATRPTLRPTKNYRNNHGGSGGKVDAIEYLTDRISELEMEIKHVRESIDKRNPMPFGFASFEKIEDAHVVAHAAKNKHPQGTTIKLAPRPHDLIWKNLHLSKKERSWKRFINNFWIVILTVVWIAPNALIAVFLSNLSNLAQLWPHFRPSFDGHHTLWAIVQGVASPAITSLIYLVLPIIFRRLSIHAGDTTKASREKHVTTRLYAFFVFNNLIVFSIFASLVQFVVVVVGETKHGEGAWEAIKQGYFFKKILNGLISVSPFWLSWLMQRNLGSAADISQVWNLIWTGFARRFMSPTPRQWIEWSAPPVMDYAIYYNYFLFYSTVALCFFTIQPLVVPITVFFFIIDYWLKKYLLLYVLITKNESGGIFWKILFNRLIFATILADCIIALAIKGNGTWIMVAVMGPLPILLIGFKWYCARTFDDQNEFFTKATLRDLEHTTIAADGKTKPKTISDRVARKFGHPALHAKLMTPMVHAKAQSVLKEIYRGRMQDDSHAFSADEPADYRDIAMDPMSTQYPGKSAGFAPQRGLTQKRKEKEMFEAVPESKLDFSYFKDRSDFRDEFGGDGDLYGRPTDLISERSGTPQSFLGHGGGYHGRAGSSGSGPSSRASSPGAGPGAGGYRSYSPGMQLQQIHPAFREYSNPRGPGMSGHVYSNSNESERELLSEAQPPGREAAGREVFGLDRWRTGGSGYMGVPNSEVEEEGSGRGMGYESYRGRAM